MDDKTERNPHLYEPSQPSRAALNFTTVIVLLTAYLCGVASTFAFFAFITLHEYLSR